MPAECSFRPPSLGGRLEDVRREKRRRERKIKEGSEPTKAGAGSGAEASSAGTAVRKGGKGGGLGHVSESLA